jgi:hypothetical protein
MAIKDEMLHISTILNRLFKTSTKQDSVSESHNNDYGDTALTSTNTMVATGKR